MYVLQLKKNLKCPFNADIYWGYANDCRNCNKKKNECKGNNARFVINQRTKRVYLKATNNIKAGGEVYVSYGKGYWNYLR